MINKSIRRGQVWFYKPTVTPTGHIQKGPRPVVIVSNDHLNQSSDVVLAVPCTTQIKRNFPTHALFIMKGKVNVALTEQMGPVNVDELTHLEYTLEEYIMNQVDEAIKVSLDFTKIATNKTDDTTYSQPVDKPVDNTEIHAEVFKSKSTGSQVDKFYSRYPQLKHEEDVKNSKWTPVKMKELVLDYEYAEDKQSVAHKYGISIPTLKTYYRKFKLIVDGGGLSRCRCFKKMVKRCQGL